MKQPASYSYVVPNGLVNRQIPEVMPMMSDRGTVYCYRELHESCMRSELVCVIVDLTLIVRAGVKKSHYLCEFCVHSSIDNRPTEKGLETRQKFIIFGLRARYGHVIHLRLQLRSSTKVTARARSSWQAEL